MKRLFKVLLVFTLIGFIGTVGFLTWFCFYVYHSSGITFRDVFNAKDISPERLAYIEQYTKQRSSDLATKVSGVIVKGLEMIVPKIDYAKVLDSPYPYPSLDEISDMQEKAFSDALAEGLNNLDDMTKQNDIIRHKELVTR